MKPHGFTGFSKHLDRFHVDEMRAQANRDRLNGEDFVDDFEQMRQEERPVTRIPDAGLRNDDFVNEFHHQQRGGFDHELDDAFDAYLERGVAGPLPPDAQHMEDLYQKAMLHVTSAYPTMGREQIKMKAEQMLHDLHLDRHPMEQAWADDFHHQHQGWHGEFMRRKHAEPVERWVEEMEQKRFEDAYEGRLNRDPHWVCVVCFFCLFFLFFSFRITQHRWNSTMTKSLQDWTRRMRLKQRQTNGRMSFLAI